MKLKMEIKYFFGAGLIFLFVLVACTFKHKEEPVDEKLLPGTYYHDHDRRDSIFVYSDKTYKHTYHRTNGTLNDQTGAWHYESDVNRIFFEDFIFYNDGGPGQSGYFRGSWPTRVFVNKDTGEVKLQYSESVYYMKAQEK